MTNSQAAAHESWLLVSSLALWDLGKAVPITSENRLPFLTENNFQTPPHFIWTPRLLMFRFILNYILFIYLELENMLSKKHLNNTTFFQLMYMYPSALVGVVTQ